MSHLDKAAVRLAESVFGSYIGFQYTALRDDIATALHNAQAEALEDAATECDKSGVCDDWVLDLLRARATELRKGSE